MVEYVKGDIFESAAQTIVNPVNTVGVMGKGLALEFKNRYPDMFRKYERVCKRNLFHIGELMLVKESDHWILLFPTKDDWRSPAMLEYIEQGMNKLVREYANRGIESIAFPKLGCGCGGLIWEDVEKIMRKYLDNLPIKTYIYV